MIKNVVFDLGQVIVRFDPWYMTGIYVEDPADVDLIAPVMFDRLYWDRLDAGTISDEEVIRLSRERLPERLWDAAEKAYYNWIYHIPLIDGMEELVRWVRHDRGKEVFLLSNISTRFSDRAEEFPWLSQFQKCIFSAACGRIKPNRDMFEYLCRECRIRPEETLFIDDNPLNIAGAEACGIKGYVFDGDVGKLRRFLETIL